MRHSLRFFPALAIASISLFASSAAAAQQSPVTVTAEDYARAESLLGRATAPLVFGAAVQPNWLSGNRFWYRNGSHRVHNLL